MNLQLSEINGENIVMGDNIDECVLNISDDIEQNCYVELNCSKQIELNENLNHLRQCLENNDKTLHISKESTNHNKLLVNVHGEGGIKLGKSSWADGIYASMGMGKK